MLDFKFLSVSFVKIKDLVEKEVDFEIWDGDIRVDMFKNMKI